MGFFYINRDPDSLAHANHKYVSRKWSGGKWVYTYPEDEKSQGKNLKSQAKSRNSKGQSTWGKLGFGNSGDVGNRARGAVENKKVADRKERATNQGGVDSGNLKNNAKRKANKTVDNKEYNTPWAREAAGSTSGKYNTAMASPTRKKAENASKDRAAKEGVAGSRNPKSHAKATDSGDSWSKSANRIAGAAQNKRVNDSSNRASKEGGVETRSLKSRAKSSGVGEERKRKENKAIDTMTDHAARARGESREYYEESMYNRRKNRYPKKR